MSGTTSPRELADGKLLIDEPAEGVVRLTISNPEKRNALDHPILGAITAPTLVLNGEFDLATRFAAADYLCRQLPHAQRCAIGAAGHLPNLDNPDAYAHACRAFLSRQLHGSTWT